ncbi:hypothetical protein RRG08_019416 [Elysia crispata]|uniref:Uncharacterized protein n=1 Tax=Elysia crispata TaxID=231223 RepID=A0AAE0Z489_9GAST|nr:hypothetical protein RRG08_019416 [Elysia crispata]
MLSSYLSTLGWRVDALIDFQTGRSGRALFQVLRGNIAGAVRRSIPAHQRRNTSLAMERSGLLLFFNGSVSQELSIPVSLRPSIWFVTPLNPSAFPAATFPCLAPPKSCDIYFHSFLGVSADVVNEFLFAQYALPLVHRLFFSNGIRYE